MTQKDTETKSGTTAKHRERERGERKRREGFTYILLALGKYGFC